MFPPVYAVCAADTTCATLLSDTDGRLRLLPFGQMPQHSARPYAVWQIIYGEPDNCITDIPDTDLFGLQFDVYAPTADGARQIAQAIRGAVEPHAFLTRYSSETRESATEAYRYSFDVEWRIYRS